MSIKHRNIPQLDGTASDDYEDRTDEAYEDTERFWRTGELGTCFQYYLDALAIIDTSDFDEEEKHLEKELVLEARTKSSGANFVYYPPWRKY